MSSIFPQTLTRTAEILESGQTVTQTANRQLLTQVSNLSKVGQVSEKPFPEKGGVYGFVPGWDGETDALTLITT